MKSVRQGENLGDAWPKYYPSRVPQKFSFHFKPPGYPTLEGLCNVLEFLVIDSYLDYNSGKKPDLQRQVGTTRAGHKVVESLTFDVFLPSQVPALIKRRGSTKSLLELEKPSAKALQSAAIVIGPGSKDDGAESDYDLAADKSDSELNDHIESEKERDGATGYDNY
ncbi:hypothetical protein MBM_09289 [Drepanopeziza brunnea f. sp. 'multigermtubi' MB_m1]|uniref:Uncharacterized protein n=1 Tax=Marssonina brunnea f. sp. multigermtubi (strain MB_m1) TaxID=1072389 RepID=K1WV55_MARBU|nr:uncharacterized protein MBM_09289 [Drepanopeziza brunnea f. sp. 'multigermtubi' MB_m1]EKD12533.1 hypothetical protein MBM_09289 [Drepanopeziza brunnea f. sp. 'multigermtubi' MB_m1]